MATNKKKKKKSNIRFIRLIMHGSENERFPLLSEFKKKNYRSEACIKKIPAWRD